MNYTQQIKNDITNEVMNLRNNLTSREFNNLNTNTFDPKTSDVDIYGQILGKDNISRIKELLSKCAVPYSQKLNHHIPVEPNTTFENRQEFHISNENNVYSILEFTLHNDPDLWESVINYMTSTIPTFEFPRLEHTT